MRFGRNRFFLAPDGGEGGGAPAPAPAEPQPAPQPQADPAPAPAPEPTYERPKYFSQVAPAKADSEEYKSLYRYQKLDELTDAAVALQRENEQLRESSKRSIVVPDGSDPEAVKEFARKLGVPDSADGYAMKSLANAGLDEDSMKTIRESCHRAMLSERQAEQFGIMILKVAQDGAKKAMDRAKARREGFDSALAASYAEIQSDIDRTAAAERDKASYQAFITETGLGEVLMNAGLSLDPATVKAIASYARKHSGQVQVTSVPGGPGPDRTDPANQYGADFKKTYGGKR